MGWKRRARSARRRTSPTYPLLLLPQRHLKATAKNVSKRAPTNISPSRWTTDTCLTSLRSGLMSPLAQSDSTEPASESRTHPPANILLVDDRHENLVALEAILLPLEQKLVTAYSGFEALRHLLREEFAVILMDVQMPEMDGCETVNLIKSR